MRAQPCDGQLTLFDYSHANRRPCDYNFRRYIGQTVHLIGVMGGDNVIGKVHMIEPYYTIVKLKGGLLMCGTPYNTVPDNKEDYYV